MLSGDVMALLQYLVCTFCPDQWRSKRWYFFFFFPIVTLLYSGKYDPRFESRVFLLDSFAFGDGLTVFFAEIQFGFEGNIDFWERVLFGFFLRELLDLEDKFSFFDSRTLLYTGFLSKFGNAKVIISDVTLMMYGSFTLMILFCSWM